MGASLYDFRDLDLMLAIADANGGIESRELAEEIGLGEDGSRAASIRLSWMRRYGMVSFDPDKRLWTLSPSGVRVVEARLRGLAAPKLDAIPEEELIDVMAHVTMRYRHGDAVIAQLLRREFLYGTQRT